MSADDTSRSAKAQHWERQIDAWQASGQSQQAFCEANNLNYPCFSYWLRKFRDKGAVSEKPRKPSGFVPIVAASPSSGLTIQLPNGIALHGVTEQNLSVVEQLLARL